MKELQVKLGEATYSEVYSYHEIHLVPLNTIDFFPMTILADALEPVLSEKWPLVHEKVAVKVIPFGKDIEINGTRQLTAEDIFQEAQVTRVLSDFTALLREPECDNRLNFVELKRFHVCHGPYPDYLIAAWDDYQKEYDSENDRPGGEVFYMDLSDESYYTGTGDYQAQLNFHVQYEIYRMMREETKGDWKGYYPKTNVMWLHYIMDKIETTRMLPWAGAGARAHRAAFKKLKNRSLSYKSMTDFVQKEILYPEEGYFLSPAFAFL
ncbi:Serine/threonine-protein kinase haspin [Phlyctochytrium bullatum]|nr:Serine/threonine-protein kinase haspin [Phlyctochytrium bullatum]